MSEDHKSLVRDEGGSSIDFWYSPCLTLELSIHYKQNVIMPMNVPTIIEKPAGTFIIVVFLKLDVSPNIKHTTFSLSYIWPFSFLFFSFLFLSFLFFSFLFFIEHKLFWIFLFPLEIPLAQSNFNYGNEKIEVSSKHHVVEE